VEPPSVVLLIPPLDPTTKPVIESRNDIPSIDCPTVLGTGVLHEKPPSIVLITEPFCRTACTVMTSVATNASTGLVVVNTVVQVEPPSVVLMIVPADPLAAPAAMYPVFASGNEID
jgi:hypothetical protein